MNNQNMYENQKYIVGIDYGNGNSIQVIGSFKANIHSLFKKIKKGKKYKNYKTKYINLVDISFVGEKVINDE